MNISINLLLLIFFSLTVFSCNDTNNTTKADDDHKVYDNSEVENNNVDNTTDQDTDTHSGEPLKVFILAGQSNMIGSGVIEPTQDHLDKNNGKGTLRYLVEDESQKPTYDHLLEDDGQWSVRNDIWIVDLDKSGPLTLQNKTSFGPELQFGHIVGNYFENQVLLIKTAWDGKSLYEDFRPPSAGKSVGPYYTMMIYQINKVLRDMSEHYPAYNNQGYEIAGFVWFQGWNDRVIPAAINEYQENCVHLINDIRDELDVTDIPFVIGVTGIGGWQETEQSALSLIEAQFAVPDDTRLTYGNVTAVETRDFWRDKSISPSIQAYHWNSNAESFFLIGDAFGKTIIELINE